MGFEIGKTVGGYEFIDVLSSSKEGVTYKVRNVLAQRFEALKVLPKKFQDDPEYVSRFMREMKVHARLVHPNIVTFYNAMEIEGQLVMTTELVEGINLAERVETGPIRWAEAVGYARQVLSALACAHLQGVVHRNITPDNITITPNGTVRLTGFGLAKTITDPQLTQAGAFLGSLHYMAPEQVKGVVALNARTDIYCLGAVLYRAATGKTPFNAKSQFDVMLAHVNVAPTPPTEVNPQLPPEANKIILKALAKDPALRYQTADEFREALASEPAVTKSSDIDRAASVGTQKMASPARLAVPAAAGLPVTAKSPSRWDVPDLMLAGIFTFLITIAGFLAFLTLSKS